MKDVPGGLFNLDSLLQENSPQTAEILLAYAGLLANKRITDKNASLCLRILGTNNKKAADILFGNSNPETFFAAVKPAGPVIESVFNLLSSFYPGELYGKTLLACIGFLKTSYSSNLNITRIYMPTTENILHTAKYLVACRDKTADCIVEFLKNLYGNEPRPESLTSFLPEIFSAYFDNTKKIDSIFPASLIEGADNGISSIKGTDAQA